MNFEIIDNFFQILVLAAAMICSAVTACKRKKWEFLYLAGGYGCFMMGTLYYVLHLVITGKVPQIFYVAEISWLAAYLFFLCLLLSRRSFFQTFSGVLPGVCAVLVAAISLANRIFGPSYFFSLCFGLTVGAIVRCCVEGLKSKEKGWILDGMLVLIVCLQIALYVVSSFIKDYTKFNAYYAVDILLTITMAAMLPVLKKEVKVK